MWPPTKNLEIGNSTNAKKTLFGHIYHIYKCFQLVNFHTRESVQYSQTFNKHIFVNEDCSNNKNAGFYTSNIWYKYTFFIST